MRYFANKTSRLGSQICLAALCMMSIFFALAFPGFTGSLNGQIFAGIWFIAASLLFAAHQQRLAEEQPQPVIRLTPGKKDARTRKSNRRVRVVNS